MNEHYKHTMLEILQKHFVVFIILLLGLSLVIVKSDILLFISALILTMAIMIIDWLKLIHDIQQLATGQHWEVKNIQQYWFSTKKTGPMKILELEEIGKTIESKRMYLILHETSEWLEQLPIGRQFCLDSKYTFFPYFKFPGWENLFTIKEWYTDATIQKTYIDTYNCVIKMRLRHSCGIASRNTPHYTYTAEDAYNSLYEEMLKTGYRIPPFKQFRVIPTDSHDLTPNEINAMKTMVEYKKNQQLMRDEF